ncbi:MAG TPA: hypothetical protein VL022_01345 [Moheibacter sp.]|nr:hypothetical protein [Moheibacter sp.]
MGNLVKKLLFCSWLFLSFTLIAQVNLSGKLRVDALEEDSLAGILVEIAVGGKIQQYVYADAEGQFNVELKDWAKYSISINDFDYTAEPYVLKIDKDSPKIIQIELQLNSQSVSLNEILIDRQKIKVKSDTIVFDAKLFAKGDEKVVEDLLKQIPGLEVDAHGVITVNGKEVERVMIEGDDFFEKGYKMVTKNMSAQPIDKVEVLQNYSHNSLLKGFEESDKIALNLTLQENAKNQWFGDLQLTQAVYPENNYSIGGNVMSFGKKNKHYFLTNWNDLGEDNTGDLSQLYARNNYFVGDQLRNQRYLHQLNSIFGLDENRYRFNQMKMASLNSIFNLSDKVKFKPKITAKWDKINFNFIEKSTYFLENDTIYHHLTQKTIDKTFELKSAADWEVVLSPRSNLAISTLFHVDHSAKDGMENFNEINSFNDLPFSSKTLDQKFFYTNLLNENNVFTTHFRFIHQNNQEDWKARSEAPLFADIFGEEPIHFSQQNIGQRLNYLGSASKWVYKTSNQQLLELDFSVQNTNNHFNTNFSLNESPAYFPDFYQNDLRLNILQAELTGKYTHAFSDRLKWLNFIGLGWMDYNYSSSKEHHSSKNVFPKFRSLLNWQFHPKHRIGLAFQHDNLAIDYQKFYGQFLANSSQNFDRGLTKNNILPTTRLQFKYDFGQFYDAINFGVESNYNLSEKHIGSQRNVFDHYQINELTILKDKKTWLNLVYFSYLFKDLAHYVKLSAFNNVSNYQNSLNNGDLREIKSQITSLEFTLNSAFKSSTISYSLNGKWNWNQYTVNNNFNNSTQNFQGFMNVKLLLLNKHWLSFSQQLTYFPLTYDQKLLLR